MNGKRKPWTNYFPKKKSTGTAVLHKEIFSFLDSNVFIMLILLPVPARDIFGER
jgi:hypothetical protein